MKLKNVLLVDGGGRGTSIAWKLRQSKELGKLYVAPGNAGTARIAENVPVNATDIGDLLAFALANKIDLTVVGQDDPLALGIVDAFEASGLRIFGPTKAAAQIEASKAFSKRLMSKHDIPTAEFVICDTYEAASMFIDHHFCMGSKLGEADEPVVIKASGLALGKGAYVCRTLPEAEEALGEIMVKKVHGSAGDEVVIERFIDGDEVSLHAFCDGKSCSLFPSAQDHKAAYDGDEGLNTGGMGTIAPVPWFSSLDMEKAKTLIIDPILQGLSESCTPFMGILFPGLKMPPTGPMTLEYNARFGDPEAQVYMRLLKSDLLEILEACVDRRLNDINIEWHPFTAACVVMASAGYPSPNYKKGVPITGIEDAEKIPGVVVFQAGTKMVNGQLVTSGGRVLGVTAIGANLEEALNQVYRGVRCIHFDGAHYRKDIGAKALMAERR